MRIQNRISKISALSVAEVAKQDQGLGLREHVRVIREHLLHEALGQEDQPADEVAHHVLAPEADADGQGTAQDREGGEGDLDHAQRGQEGDEQQEVEGQ
jgi:hypothetical protein